MVVSHFRLLTTRFRETFIFYRGVIKLPTTYKEDSVGPYAEFELGSDRYLGLFDRALTSDAVSGLDREPAAKPDDRMVICASVEDVDAEAERLTDLGIQLVAGPTNHEPWGLRTIHLRDPEGNLIELYSGIPAA
jgi:predicted enzyme related to lactoylglutathione lyase